VAETAQLGSSSGLSSWLGPFACVLANGLRVVFAQREKSPIVELRFVVEGGFASDPKGRNGLAGAATAMFSEGLLRLHKGQVGDALEPLGALLHGQVMADAAVIGMSALAANLDHALSMLAHVLMNPEFEAEDLELLRTNRLALIARERLNPSELALHILPPMVYGADHEYARPLTGSGIKREVAALTSDDLRSYYSTYLRPECCTLVVAGPCDTAHLHAQLEEAFGNWRTASAPARPTRGLEAGENAPSIMIVNHPGASQAALAAGWRTIARNSSRAEALMVADAILGGMFTSRLNLSLREHKGWTYGVHSSLMDARLQGLWLIRTAVRAECAAQAMVEIANEVENLAGRRPATPDEFARATDFLVARIPGFYETSGQMADALAHAIIYRLPIEYPKNLASCLGRLTPNDVRETCQQILPAGGLRWVVVGQAARLLDQVRNAGLGNVRVAESKSAEVL
jgi:zinc protease